MNMIIYTLNSNKKYNFRYAQKINAERKKAIMNYFWNEAGVKPVTNGFLAYIINKEEWKNSSGGFVLKAKVSDEEVKELVTSITLVKADEYKGDCGNNAKFAHEILGHLGFQQYISAEDDDEDAHRVSEAFSRTVGSFVDEDKAFSILDANIGEIRRSYPPGTGDLTQKAFILYSKTGKKAIMSLFYTISSKAPYDSNLQRNNTLIDKVHDDKELLKAIAVIATRFGGYDIGDLIKNNCRGKLIKKAKRVYEELNKKSSGITEQDLMFKHLKSEFALEDSFTRVYLENTKPSCLDELIEKKDLTIIDRVSELKWIYAHGGTDSPDYRRGLSLLNHFMKTIRRITAVNGLEQAPQFQDEVMVKYAKWYGSGDSLEKHFKKFGVTYRDINDLFNSAKIPFIVLKRALLYAFMHPFRKK